MRFGTLLLATGILSGCGDFLSVTNPSDLVEEDINNQALIDALANTAEGAVSMAYDSAVVWGELPADGIMAVSTRTDMLRIDRGDFDGLNENYEAIYNGLSAARWTTSFAVEQLRSMVPDPDGDLRVARSYVWDAVARITLADLFEEVTFDGQAPITPVAVYEGALGVLDKAITILGGGSDKNFLAAALATKARVARSLYFETGQASWLTQAGTLADQALAAAPDFRVDIRYQLPGRGNLVYRQLSVQLDHTTMGVAYVDRTDPASGKRDPRVVHSELKGFGNSGDPYYFQQKYKGDNDDVPISRWQEARLIRAESRLVSGDLPGAVSDLNAVRAAAGLPDFASNNADEIKQQLIYERATEFWLELRRWADMRYYGIVPDRWTEANKARGVNRRWPISQRERGANPNVPG